MLGGKAFSCLFSARFRTAHQWPPGPRPELGTGLMALPSQSRGLGDREGQTWSLWLGGWVLVRPCC